ncbi:hypothetical protein UXZ76_23555, partial [Escherichia coli]|nr:hypothetical protein [Escherichia coli]MDY8086494.1 hypothetical protein [Escherichia coli]MDY8130102.1 hypothetical protein [Escherichia coli]
PSLIAFFHGHFASMCPFRWRYSGFSLKQQRILAHDPVLKPSRSLTKLYRRRSSNGLSDN